MMKGDRFRAILAGGGGYGHPFERDPELVLNDVTEEKDHDRRTRVSTTASRSRQGPRFAVDVAATKKLRARHNKRKVPIAAE